MERYRQELYGDVTVSSKTLNVSDRDIRDLSQSSF